MSTLSIELTTDPLARGYAGMSNLQAANDLDTAYRTRIKASMSGNQIFVNTVASEFAALTSTKQQLWVAFCSSAAIDPGNAANVAFVQFIFGNTAATVTALSNARVETISRATELGLPTVTEQMVREARANG